MPRKQNENLVPFTGEQSRDEAVKNGKKGGKASGAARRKKKAMREEFEELLSLTLTNPKLIQNLEGLGIPVKKDTTIQTAILAAMIHQAAKGNVKAFKEIKDTVETAKAEEKEKMVTDRLELMRDAFARQAREKAEEDDGDE